jgi:1,4-dihydroxy-2-naphthoate octaprenyltransferase
VWRPATLLVLLAVPLAIPPVRQVLGGAEGKELIGVLGATGRLQLAFGALLAAGIAI